MSEPLVTPQVKHIVNDLREKIRSGAYGNPGTGRIPTTSELTRDYKVARSTIYTVLQILQAEGIIRAKGKYLIVDNTSLVLEGITKSFEGFLRDKGLTIHIENLIEPTLEIMPKDVAGLFGIGEGVHVVHRMRLQGTDDQSLRIAENWYPASLAGQFVEDMKKDDRVDVLAAIQKVHGLYITHSQDVVIGRVPTPFESEHLHIPRSKPIVEIRRSNFSEDGTPIMWNKIIHVAPNFQFTYRYNVDHWK